MPAPSFLAAKLGTRFARRVRFPTGREPPQGAVTRGALESPRLLRGVKKLFLQVVPVVSLYTLYTFYTAITFPLHALYG